MQTERGTSLVAFILISLGILFLIANLVPALGLSRTWPMFLVLMAAALYLPAFMWPSERRGLVALFIPASVLLVLGLIFLYNTFTLDWGSWAYAWTLIPAGVGLGLVLASGRGGWASRISRVGIWFIVISLTAFGFFGSLFGSSLIQAFGPILLILGGGLLLLRSFRRPARSM